MKKILCIFIAFAVFSFAKTVDTGSIKFVVTGYKTKTMQKTSGTFKDIKYNFKSGDTIKSIFEGANLAIDTAKVDMKVPLITNNVRNGIFSKFTVKDIKVVIVNVMEGQNLGTMVAKITMNGNTSNIPLVYKVQNDTITLTGRLDLLDFNGAESIKELARIAPAHQGITWNIVDIELSAKLQ